MRCASQAAARFDARRYCSGTVPRRIAIRCGSTELAVISASTKFSSFSRKAQSLATQRSCLSRHHPINRGSPVGPAVWAFCTFTSRSRHLSGSAEVCRSTPSMLKPCVCAKGESSPATPSISSARRAISPSVSVMGRMSISSDLVASRGSSYSGKVPKDGLGADDDYLSETGDLAGCTDGVLELIAAHYVTDCKAWRRSSSGSSPLIGEDFPHLY